MILSASLSTSHFISGHNSISTLNDTVTPLNPHGRVQIPIMAQFTDLPNEVIIMIAESVLPGDIVSFSATSKNLQHLSEPFLRKDREMKRKYRNYICNRRSRQVSRLLHDIILQPSVALYVKCLTVETGCDVWDQDEPKPSHTGYLQQKMVSLKKAVAGSLSTHEVSEWATAIGRGEEGPLLALLLLQLSNVATIKLRGSGDTCERLFQTLKRIPETSGAPRLSRLTTLEINSRNSGPDLWCDDWRAINVFAALPSLRSVVAWNLSI